MLEEILRNYRRTDDIFEDVRDLFSKFGKLHIFEHSKKVAQKSIQLAERFHGDIEKVKIASYLHDISGIVKDADKIEFAESLKIDILDEERSFPLILHQKLSKEIAKMVFSIKDEEILQAISCHTTLHGNPSKLDMLLFISDKIEWDQDGEAPYLNIVEESLNISLEKGTGTFVKYLIDNKASLKVVHPWLIDAHAYFDKP